MSKADGRRVADGLARGQRQRLVVGIQIRGLQIRNKVGEFETERLAVIIVPYSEHVENVTINAGIKVAPTYVLVNVEHTVTRCKNWRQKPVAACDLSALDDRVQMAIDGDVKEIGSGRQAQKRGHSQVHVLSVTKINSGNRLHAYRNLVRRIFKAALFEYEEARKLQRSSAMLLQTLGLFSTKPASSRASQYTRR